MVHLLFFLLVLGVQGCVEAYSYSHTHTHTSYTDRCIPQMYIDILSQISDWWSQKHTSPLPGHFALQWCIREQHFLSNTPLPSLPANNAYWFPTPGYLTKVRSIDFLKGKHFEEGSCAQLLSHSKVRMSGSRRSFLESKGVGDIKMSRRKERDKLHLGTKDLDKGIQFKLCCPPTMFEALF